MSKEDMIKRVSVLIFRRIKASHRSQAKMSEIADVFREAHFV